MPITPGDWTLVNRDRPFRVTIEPGDGYEGLPIGLHVRWIQSESDSVIHGIAMVDADRLDDAQLLAAAPELLEACTRAAECDQLCGECRDLIESAIAKATGGAA